MLHPAFRMNDDAQVRCYAILVETLRSGTATQAQADEVRRNWFGPARSRRRLPDRRRPHDRRPPDVAQRRLEEGPPGDRGQPAAGRPRRGACWWRRTRSPLFDEMNANPAKFLAGRAIARRQVAPRAGGAGADQDDRRRPGRWPPRSSRANGARTLSAEERNWLWGAIGRQVATKLSPMANSYFANVTKLGDLSDDMLAWKARAALRSGELEGRAGRHRRHERGAAAGPDLGLLEGPRPAGRRRRRAPRPGPHAVREHRRHPRLLRTAGARGTRPARRRADPAGAAHAPRKRTPPAATRRSTARSTRSRSGMRPEGTREWNYATNLHDKGGMGDRELLAAADLACQREVWDRCINTSERTKGVIDVDQRFPMPFHDAVLRKSQEIGLDPAYVYGLIRQESRFIMDARSGVGASGLMQVMPATARWTAKKIGMADFTPGQITRPRHQHHHRHQLPQAGAGRLRRLDGAGRGGLQRRPGPAAQLAQRTDHGGRRSGPRTCPSTRPATTSRRCSPTPPTTRR